MPVSVKSHSIVKKFIIPVLIIMVVQTVLFACIFLLGGTIHHLNDNSFDILTERTSSRKNALQNEMIQNWSSFGPYETSIASTIEEILQEKNISPDQIDNDISVQILDGVSDQIVSLLRDDSVTTAFLILNGKDSSFSKHGILLRDSDPTTNSENNSDLTIEYAPPSVTKNLGISLDSNWESNFYLDPSDPESAYYYKPYEAALDYPDVQSSDLAYWSPPFNTTKNSAQPVITYTMPLRLQDGTVIGVIGTGVSTDYVSTFLPYQEIDINKSGAYLLGVSNDGSQTIQNLLTSGPIAKQLIGNSQQTQLVSDSASQDIYTLQKDERINETVFASAQPLHLYNSNTPFEDDQWVLLGIIEGKHLLDSSYQVTMMAIVSALISVIFGIIAAVIAGRHLTSPIISLANTLKSTNAQLPIRFEKTHISEVDRLADAIEVMSRDIEESASKLSKIIRAANISIGAYEYSTITDQVTITGRFFSMFGLEEQTHMNGRDFRTVMNAFSSCIEHQAEQNVTVYKITDAKGNLSWLRLKLVQENNQILGVLSDITQETLEKRKLEYERDYDLLTNLLNRRAFQTIIQDLFKTPEKLKVAAFMMWDLDNLKYINDTYGHDYGDEYIKEAADVLKLFLSKKNSIVARMSGDEFYVFLYGYESKAEIEAIIEPVKAKIESSSLFLPDMNDIKIRASAGIAWYPDDSTDYTKLIRYADFAMYTVKNTEKGKIADFNKDIYDRDSFLLHSKEELNKLIENELIHYVFQPIVDAHTGNVFAYEALMRPQSSTLRSPLEILRIAHAQSQLHQIESLTMFKAVRTYLQFPDQAAKRKLFINTLPSQILSGKNLEAFEDEFYDFLDNIVFEFMESERLDEKFTAKKLELFQKWNASIALDDYGTGYSSDSILLQLNPDYVKIDMSIVRDIDTDPNRQLLFENLSSFLKHKKTKIIAEGVETYAELKTLISLGVDYVQGYYLGIPEKSPAIASLHAQEIRELN